MIKIGIVAGRSIEPNRPFLNTTAIVDNYVKIVDELNALPIGVVFPDGVFKEEYITEYDGFILTGGTFVRPHHLGVIHYAITHNKPILGICLGLQALGTYTWVCNELKKQEIEISYGNLINFFGPIHENEELYLEKINGHDLEETFYTESIPNSQHPIYLEKDSIIYNIYKEDIIYEPSIHKWALKDIYADFKVTGKSPDGYIEVIEHTNKDIFALGVQFHPELEDKNKKLFIYFMNEINKRG